MPPTKEHNQVVREEFTRQATAYAANPVIADPERVARLVHAVRPTSQDRVLEVATGPGYVAMGFAAVAREVVGVDLTEAPLAIAEQRRQEQGCTTCAFNSRTPRACHLQTASLMWSSAAWRFTTSNSRHACCAKWCVCVPHRGQWRSKISW